MFSRNPMAIWQNLAHPAMVTRFAFAKGLLPRNDGRDGQTHTVAQSSEYTTYPSPIPRSGLFRVRPFFIPADFSRSDDKPRHAVFSRGISFYGAEFGVEWGHKSTSSRGFAVCVSTHFFWQDLPQFHSPPVTRAATRPRLPSARLAARWPVRSLPMPPVAARPKARSSAQSRAAFPAASRAFRPAANILISPRAASGPVQHSKDRSGVMPGRSFCIRTPDWRYQKGLTCSKRS
jgi:hypothetical protein